MKKNRKLQKNHIIYFLIGFLTVLAFCQLIIFAKLSPEEALREKLEAELSKDAEVVIVVSRTNEGPHAILKGNITNVSSKQLNHLVINGMTFRDRKDSGFRYSVVHIFEEQKISVASLYPQEMLSFEMIIPDINWDGLNLNGVIFVQQEQSEKKEILQAVYID